MKIVTITFSPCIDKTTSVSKLLPDKKLRCSVPKLEAGGGGINIARAIKKLGGEAIAVYPAGGYTGKYFNSLLSQEEVPAIIIDTKSETRENIIVVDETTNQQYQFGMPGTELSENEWEACLQAVEKLENLEFVVASGSLPPGVPANIYARLAVITKKKHAKLIVDTSGDALTQATREGVYLLKPNLGELSLLMGMEKINENEIEDIARQAVEKGYCELLVVSMGGSGAILVTKNENHYVVAPKVERKSTVGAGDSMVAGLVLALSRGEPLKTVLEYGVACGTAATMNPGTELCRKADVEKLFAAIHES